MTLKDRCEEKQVISYQVSVINKKLQGRVTDPCHSSKTDNFELKTFLPDNSKLKADNFVTDHGPSALVGLGERGLGDWGTGGLGDKGILGTPYLIGIIIKYGVPRIHGVPRIPSSPRLPVSPSQHLPLSPSPPLLLKRKCGVRGARCGTTKRTTHYARRTFLSRWPGGRGHKLEADRLAGDKLEADRLAGRSFQSGFALVMVMVSVLILEIICFFLAQSRGIQTMMVFNRTKKLKALYLAEAGLAHGLWRLQKEPGCRTQMADSLGDGSYTVSFTEDTLHRLIIVNSQSMAQGTKSSAQRTVCWLTIQPKSSGDFKGEDAYISEKYPNAKYGYTDPNGLMLNSQTGERYRTLVRFNLGKYSIPPDAAVISSRFSLYLVKGPSASPSSWPSAVSYRLHRITRPSDNVKWVDFETTWKNRTSSRTWTNAGGDFDSGYEDSRTFTALGWQTWSATVMTRLWMQNPSQNNYGLILEAAPMPGSYEFKFHSSANTTDPALSPKLTVYYLDSRRP